jgi:perosamine synthetase
VGCSGRHEVQVLKTMTAFGKQVVPERNIPLAKPVFTKEMEKAAVDALRNEFFVFGESVYKFEEEFARYCGTDYAVSVNSGTDALQIALLALEVLNGQRIVTTPASFIATANVILHAGCVPVFWDIDLETYTLAPRLLEQAVGKGVKAVIPVHLYGYPADMDSINDVASKHELYSVEDACQAHGGLYKGRKVGSLGDVACFSFYPSKNMTVGGDGGMLVTNDKKVAVKAAKLRDCGRKSKYVHDVIGYTARLNTVNAAIGRVQLKYLDEWNEKRRRNAAAYDAILSDIAGVIVPPKGDSGTKPVYHVYVIRTRSRDALAEWLGSNGVHCGINYTSPIHLQPIYRKMFGYTRGMFPASEKLCKTCLSLPMYPELSREDVTFVSEKIHEFYEKRN